MADQQRRKARPISQILEDPNRGIHKTYGAWGLLSKLFRIILKDNRINGYRYTMLMMRFLKDPKNRSKKGNTEHTDNRGNLNKEFSNPIMSWKVFIKGLKFVQYRKIRITIEGEQYDGTINIHRSMVDLENDVLINDPRWASEIEAAEGNPDAPNLTVPDDQEHIPYLDDGDEFPDEPPFKDQ